MNKGNLNKLVTNYPVPLTNEEVENLSLTLSAVRTAGGGGSEGKTYNGVGYVSVNNTNNTISLTTEANEKLNQPIPTKVSDLTDSANYQTVAGMAEYLTTGDAQSTYLTKTSASETFAPLSITADVDILKSSSANWNKVSEKLDTTAFSNVSGTFLTAIPDTYATKEYANNASANALSEAKSWVGQQGYLSAVPDTYALKTDIPTTVAQLTDSGNYYKKTETSSKEALDTAFGSKQDNLTQEQLSAISSVSSIKGTILTGDSNIRATPSESGSNIVWTLELTAQPVVTDTTLSGYDGIVATKDSSVSSQWNVGIAQAYKEKIEAVSSKLTKSSADTLYAQISVAGDVDTLTAASARWDEVSAKLGTAQYATDSATFVTKPDTTQTVLNNNYLIYSTLTDPTATTGWMPLSANYYSKYVKYIYSIPICAVWACETACFIVRNGPFCVLKRPVSERKMA